MKFIQPEWPAPSQIKAFTTVRSAWGNRLPHHDLNRGHFTANHPDYKIESYALKNLLQLPSDPIWVTQDHTNIALAALPENKEKTADATFTHQPNHVCVILTADCLPILLCSKQGDSIAAIHAGWRGLASGIIETTLEALKTPSDQLLAWLGPAIGPEKFEVGADVYDAFVDAHPEAKSAFRSQLSNKWLANLYELAKLRLKAFGIDRIYGGNFCTFSQEDLFFSYRRDKGKTGRMASVIWINPV